MVKGIHGHVSRSMHTSNVGRAKERTSRYEVQSPKAQHDGSCVERAYQAHQNARLDQIRERMVQQLEQRQREMRERVEQQERERHFPGQDGIIGL